MQFQSKELFSYIARWKYPTQKQPPERCSMKKDFLRNFTKFTGKHLTRVSFLIKLQARPRPATLLKKRLWLPAQVFSHEVCKQNF